MTWKPYVQAVLGFKDMENTDSVTYSREDPNKQNAVVDKTAEIEVQCGNGLF